VSTEADDAGEYGSRQTHETKLCKEIWTTFALNRIPCDDLEPISSGTGRIQRSPISPFRASITCP
jgi:hypothetical protein